MRNLQMTQKGEYFAQKLIELGRLVRGAILSARGRGADLAGVAKWTSSDAIYELDALVEPVIEGFCEHWATEVPLVLIAEGIGETGQEGKLVFPRGSAESAAQVRIIMDPIDGTRELMFDKRSAWFLAGAAPNKMDATRLSDVFAAAQVELPVSKQSAADLLWAVRGQGTRGMREEVRGSVFQKTHDLAVRPSQEGNINHGFASVSNFFPATKVLASRLMEEIARACVGSEDLTRATVFDDQYMTNGGQLYELMMGHDRFVADFRPLFYRLQGMPVGMSVHPYDMASVLVAREAGIEITDGLGAELDAPLDVDTPLCWAGYANKALRERIEPVIKRVIGGWMGAK
jgi:hypothetical protein